MCQPIFCNDDGYDDDDDTETNQQPFGPGLPQGGWPCEVGYALKFSAHALARGIEKGELRLAYMPRLCYDGRMADASRP
jgi:hypothetical protein